MNFSLRALNRCDWYVIIWSLYQMQGLLYPEGPIGQALQVLMLAWAMLETKDYILPSKCHPSLLKATSILLIMYCIYGIPLILFNPYDVNRPHYYLQSYLASFLTVILFYRYIKEGYLTEQRLKKYIWIFLAVVIWHYFKRQQEMLTILRKIGSKSEEVTNNAGYEFLALLPITFFYYKKPLFQYSLLCIILLFIVMAMKRGPILIGAICFIWTLIINITSSENKKQKYATICLGIVIVLVGAGYIAYQYSTSDYMVERFKETREGKSSGREHLYSKSVEIIFDDNSVSHLLIGRGGDATKSFFGKPAHQDWFETAINNGLVGIIILLYFCIAFVTTVVRKNVPIPKQIHSAFCVLFFIFITKTMFSMSLADMPCFQSMLISFCIYCKENGLPQPKRISFNY